MIPHRQTVYAVAMRLLAALLPAVAAIQAGCAIHPAQPSRIQAASETAPLDGLLGLMRQRLALMHEVARWKWNSGKPIADPDRERDLLNHVTTSGQEKGLSPNLVHPFFAAQIEAGKFVQRTDFEHWRAEKQGKFPEAKDLAAVREQINALNDRLIDALAATSSLLSHPKIQETLDRRAEHIVTSAGIDSTVWNVAIAPLKKRTRHAPGS